jgi:hypothetical protein
MIDISIRPLDVYHRIMVKLFLAVTIITLAIASQSHFARHYQTVTGFGSYAPDPCSACQMRGLGGCQRVCPQ